MINPSWKEELSPWKECLIKAKVAETDNVDVKFVRVEFIVVLNHVEVSERIEYRIVGPAETDVLESKISSEV
jgi:transcription elongation factor GreA